MSRVRPLAAAVIVALFLVSAAAYAGLPSIPINLNPANDGSLLKKPIDSSEYDQATHCSGKDTPGAKKLSKWLDNNTRGSLWGIYRCEKWGKNSASVHAEGRAIDWHLDARVKKEKKAAEKLIAMLLASDKQGNEAALARRMGVQGIIYNCRAWWGYGSELGDYSYCYNEKGKKMNGLDPTASHVDHIHIELNKRGAKLRTSFWQVNK